MLSEATDNIVALLEYAVEYPELLPKCHYSVVPNFKEARIHKEQVTTYMTPKGYKQVQALDCDFRGRIEAFVKNHAFKPETLQYIEFAHNFGKNLHKANAAIPESIMKEKKESVQKQIEEGLQVNKLSRLPPLDLLEAVQQACLVIFKTNDPNFQMGKSLFKETINIHDSLCKFCKEPAIADIDYQRYLWDVAVLVMQSDYQIKYKTAFWQSFHFESLDRNDVYFLLNNELKMFNPEWQMPKSAFKHVFLELHGKGSKAKTAAHSSWNC